MPAELKRARADYVIDNNGSLVDLEAKVEKVWLSLLERCLAASSNSSAAL
jgi:dephospho-CoA kinase